MNVTETDTPFGTLRLSVEGAVAGEWAKIDLPAAGARAARTRLDLAKGREAAMTLELVTPERCDLSPAPAAGLEAHLVRSSIHSGAFGMPDGVWIDAQPSVRLTEFAADATSISYAVAAIDDTTLIIPAAIAWMTSSDTDRQAVLAALTDTLSPQGIPTCPKS